MRKILLTLIITLSFTGCGSSLVARYTHNGAQVTVYDDGTFFTDYECTTKNSMGVFNKKDSECESLLKVGTVE